MPIEAVSKLLAADDDPRLWELAIKTTLNDAVNVCESMDLALYAEVGCCRHWIRPHQSRWTAGGGFAAPYGYDPTTTGYSFRALPVLDWSVHLQWNGSTWEVGRTGAACLRLRVAIPGRSARHLQAAVHTVWVPRSPTGTVKQTQLFGFRKLNGDWNLMAHVSFPVERSRRAKR